MSFYPCPNPICSHTFTPEEVHSAAALKCPVCGQVFQFRTGAAPAQPGPHAAKPVPGPLPSRIPIAKPAAPFVQLGAPVHAAATLPPVAGSVAQPAAQAASIPDSGSNLAGGAGPLVQPRLERAVRSHRHLIFLGIGILLGFTLIIGGVLALKAVFRSDDSSFLSEKGQVIIGTVRGPKSIEENAFKLILANRDWTPASDMRKRLGVITAWKGVDKDGWFAVSVRDYGLMRPRDAELLGAGIERLEQYFEGTLELAEKAEPARLDDMPGQRLLFKGRLNSVTWWGHMYMLAHHGLGYWIYVAAPSKEEAEELFAQDLQGGEHGFFLYTQRKGWREQPPKIDSFATADGAMTVTAPEGVFVRHSAKDQDEHGELYLFAKYQKEQDNRKNAGVLVLALAKQEGLKEALQSTRQYLEHKKQEESKDYKVEAAGEAGAPLELGVAAAVGNQPGRIAEYKLLRGDAAVRFWIVAVVNDRDKVYAIRCDCNWESRQIWREDFQELLRSVTFRQGPPMGKEEQMDN
jgi:hypothetical protein